MLFHVKMDVRIPHDFSPDEAAKLKATEKQRSQELHDILSTLPLFPFMEITVSPLCRHPSSIREDDK